jgi:hypothetical protein
MNSKYEQYTKVSYSGRELLKKHSLTEVGTWQIYGEDPNCDMGGHHHEPELGVVTGNLKDVIEYAVNLPNFWAWGGGGRIAKIVVRDVKTERYNQVRIAELDRQIEKLVAEKKKLLEA